MNKIRNYLQKVEKKLFPFHELMDCSNATGEEERKILEFNKKNRMKILPYLGGWGQSSFMFLGSMRMMEILKFENPILAYLQAFWGIGFACSIVFVTILTIAWLWLGKI